MAWSKSDLNDLKAKDYWQALYDAINGNPFDKNTLRLIVNAEVPSVSANATNEKGLTRLNILVRGVLDAAEQGDNKRADGVYEILNGFLMLNDLGDLDGKKNIIQDIPGKDGRNALEMAVQKLDSALVELMLKYKFYYFYELTKMYYQVKSVNTTNDQHKVASIKQIINLLVKYKAKVSYDNSYFKESCNVGDTLMHSAFVKGDYDLVKDLVKDNADFNVKDKWGRFLWVSAIGSNDESLISLLLDAGADVNAEDTYGEPLLLAVGNNNESMTGLLLDAGADVNVKYEKRNTLIIALMAGAPTSDYYNKKKEINRKLIQKLLTAGVDLNEGTGSKKIRYETHEGLGSLSCAVLYGNVDIVSDMLRLPSKDKAANMELILQAIRESVPVSESVAPEIIYISPPGKAINGDPPKVNCKELINSLLSSSKFTKEQISLFLTEVINSCINDNKWGPPMHRKNESYAIAELLHAGADYERSLIPSPHDLSKKKLSYLESECIYYVLEQTNGVFDQHTVDLISTLIKHGFKRGAAKSLLAQDKYKEYANAINEAKKEYRDKKLGKVLDNSIESPDNKPKTLSMFEQVRKKAGSAFNAKKTRGIKDSTEQPLLDKPRSESTASTDSKKSIDEDKGKERKNSGGSNPKR